MILQWKKLNANVQLKCKFCGSESKPCHVCLAVVCNNPCIARILILIGLFMGFGGGRAYLSGVENHVENFGTWTLGMNCRKYLIKLTQFRSVISCKFSINCNDKLKN
jgi:hypothetical protein